MEMGSSTSTESLDGLKFGHKIYFEQDSCSSSGPASPAATKPKKVRSSPVQAGQPPRCQVEGCEVDLSDSKAYYSRHKVCGTHSKSATVVVAGLQQRFCQQCSRFHLLPEFDQGKRSCRRRLAGHNERRRKPPPGSILPPRYEPHGRVGSFLMDFSSYSRLGRDAWQVGRTPLGGAAALPWQGSSTNNDGPPPPDLFSAGRAGLLMHSPPLPQAGGECIPAAADSNCALSLLSNQPWVSSRSRSSPSGFGLHSMVSSHAPPMGEPATASPLPPPSVSHFSATAHWGLKGDSNNSMGSASGSHQSIPGLGLGQFSQQQHGQVFELGRRLYSEEPGQSRGLNPSTNHMNWSL